MCVIEMIWRVYINAGEAMQGAHARRPYVTFGSRSRLRAAAIGSHFVIHTDGLAARGRCCTTVAVRPGRRGTGMEDDRPVLCVRMCAVCACVRVRLR